MTRTNSTAWFLALLLSAACTGAGTPTDTGSTGESEAARPGTAALAGPMTVNGSRAHELVAAGALLVDVRTPQEFAAGAIEGAINVPVDQIGSRLAELEPRDRPVVVYCRSGRRSAAAADTLFDAGFAQVYDLGGMTNW